jgi:hypothetical protein
VSEQPVDVAGRVQRLWDDACIRTLAIDYADSVLVRDAARMASLWATDAGEAAPPDFDYRWAQRISERWPEWGVTMLHVTTHAIRFDGDDEAHGRVQCLVQLDSVDFGFVEQSIMYEDDYVRRGPDWLFATRRHRLWFGATRMADPLRQDPAGWPAGIVGSGSLADDLAALAQRRDAGNSTAPATALLE